MEPESGGGYELLMNDGSTTEYQTMFGSDTYAGGWFNMVFDCDLFTTLTLANVQRWGIRVQHTASAKNLDNVWIDYIRYLDGIYVTGGTSGDEIDLDGIAIQDADFTNGYGIMLNYEGVFIGYGQLQIGNGATTTYFEMDGDVLVFSDQPVATNFYEISGNGTGADIVFNDAVIQSAGVSDNTRFVFDMSSTDITLSCTNSVFFRGSTITFASGQTVIGNTFNDCGQITHAGADMDGCTVKNYEGTANTSALIYDVNADPDGEMDGMTFIKGTAATHAIEFGTTSPLTMTLRDCIFTSYNASDSQNDSTFHFKRTTDTVTLNLIGCTGNFSYRSDGATVNIVVSPVTLGITVTDTSSPPVAIESARVLVWVTNSANYFYRASVSITGSGTTATVTHSTHGLSSGDEVIIEGVENDDAYNGAWTITVSDASTYTYTTSQTISSSPATGTSITSTMCLIDDVTNVSGYVSDTRSWGFDQPIAGRIRMGSGSPYYKQGSFVGTIDTDTGLPVAVQLIDDE